ncbi:YfhO family protein [Acidobacteriota bacterium]
MKDYSVAILSLILILIGIFFPVLFQGKVLLPLDALNTMHLPYAASYDRVEAFNHIISDVIFQYYPYKLMTKKAWKSGQIAYWSPYYYGGYPLYAETMSGYFDITNFVLLLFPMPQAYHLQILLQLFIAGFGMFLLLRLFKIRVFISVLFGAAYMLNNIFIESLFHRWILASFCWVPFQILFLILYHKKNKTQFLILTALATAMSFMGGSFQTSAYIVFTIFIVNWMYVFQRGKKIRWKIVLGIPFLVVAIGFLLSAVMWLPSLELLGQDIQDGASRISTVDKTYTLWQRTKTLPFFLTSFIPELDGSARGFYLSKLTGGGERITGFIGFLPLLFGIMGGFLLWKKDKVIRIFMILAGLGIFIPLFTPLYRFVYYRFLIIFIFGIVIVGAKAFNVFLDRESPDIRWKKTIRSSAILSSCVFGGVLLGNLVLVFKGDVIIAKCKTFIQQNMSQGQFSSGNEAWTLGRVDQLFKHYSLTSISMIIPFCCITLVFIALYAYMRKPGRKGLMILGAGVMVLTLFQLAFLSYSWLPMSDSEKFPVYPQTKTIQYLSKDQSDFRVLPLSDNKSKRVFQPNILSVYGISTATGYESIRPSNMEDLINGVDLNPDLLGMLNIKYILTSPKHLLNIPALKLVDSTEINVYENLNWKPRVYMMYKAVKEEEALIKANIMGEDYDASFIYLEELPKEDLIWMEEPVNNRVEFVETKENSFVVNVTTEKKGYLVLSDTYYPGWRARDDGKTIKIYRANRVMRAVVLDKGTHRVEFDFSPLSFKIGWLLSLGAGLFCLIFLIYPLQNRKRQRS